VVVAAGGAQLRVPFAQPGTDPLGGTQVERGAVDRHRRTGRDEVLVHAQDVRREELHLVVLDAARARQVPVGVVGEIDDRGRVGGGPVLEAQLVALHLVGDADLQRAGEAVLPGGAGPVQGDGAPVRLADLPLHRVEGPGAAVQGCAGLVRGDPVLDAVELEDAAGDAVREPAHAGAQVGRVAPIGVGVGETQRDVCPATLPVGRADRADPCAVTDHVHLEPAAAQTDGVEGARRRLGDRLHGRHASLRPARPSQGTWPWRARFPSPRSERRGRSPRRRRRPPGAGSLLQPAVVRRTSRRSGRAARPPRSTSRRRFRSCERPHGRDGRRGAEHGRIHGPGRIHRHAAWP
jgi:hypothetical protein